MVMCKKTEIVAALVALVMLLGRMVGTTNLRTGLE